MQIRSAGLNLFRAAFVAAIILLPGRAVFADTLDYTFSGVGAGTIGSGKTSTSFNGAFSISFVANTSEILPADPGYYLLPVTNGIFTEGGFTATITNAEIEVNGNPFVQGVPGSWETVFLFDPSFGSIGISFAPDLLDYALSTPIHVPGTNGTIGAFQSVSSFPTTGGGSVAFSGLTSLDFDVTEPQSSSPVPEPSTLALLSAGLSGAGMLRRRFLS
jgi:hypothetical protein